MLKQDFTPKVPETQGRFLPAGQPTNERSLSEKLKGQTGPYFLPDVKTEATDKCFPLYFLPSFLPSCCDKQAAVAAASLIV